ncbi:hypothetical protein DRO32_02345 [Candidatus Bathyarchaeota archaeon]|nr:MAG: hypothetical protein DRO32_02345 [Candidatus Bathyarchaeota archaeon]
MHEAELLGRSIVVAGLRGVEVGDPGELLENLRARRELGGLVFQLLDAGMVAGPEHLLVAILNALRAFELGLNVSSDLGMEILTFASGQRQISEAIRSLGLKPGRMDVALVLVAGSRREAEGGLRSLVEALGGEEDDGVLEVDDEKAGRLVEAYGIGSRELSSCGRLGSLPDVVRWLVVEKVALSMAYR